MKLKLFTLILIVLTTLPIADSKTPLVLQKPEATPRSELERLELLFKELDKQEEENEKVNASIDFDFPKNNEKSGEIKVKRANKKPETISIDLDDLQLTDEFVNNIVRVTLLKEEPTGTLPGAVVMQIGATNEYILQKDYTYDSGKFSITAKKDFQYDRASVPAVVWFITRDSLSNVAPLFHDLLYRNGGVLPQDQVTPYRKFSRQDTDDLFLELMKKSGVKKWRQKLAYKVVREISWFAWKEKKD